MSRTLEDNWNTFNEMNQYKAEHGIYAPRASGRTTRAVFELASQTPDGNAYFVSDNMAQLRHAFEILVDILVYTGAPIEINGNANTVKLGKTTYRFITKIRYEGPAFEGFNDTSVYNHEIY